MTRLAVAAPVSPRCGVHDYAHQLAASLPSEVEVSWVDLPESVDRDAWAAVASRTAGAQAVHVHYEYGLFHTVKPLRNRFATFADRVHAPLLVTLHDALPELRPRWRDGAPYRWRDAIRDVLYLPFFPGWSRHQYQRAAHFIVHTKRMWQGVVTRVGPDAVTHLIHPVPRTSRLWAHADSEPATFVTPGFTKPHKGYEQIVPHLGDTRARRWVLAGGPQDARDEAYLRRLKATMAECRCADVVQITGYLPRPRLEERLLRARLAVFPYRWAEGSGALSWALALGMPVAAADLPAFRELALAGAGIEILPAEAVGSWGARVGALLSDTGRLSELAALNRRFARSHGMPAAGRTLAELVRRLAAGEGTTAPRRA